MAQYSLEPGSLKTRHDCLTLLTLYPGPAGTTVGRENSYGSLKENTSAVVSGTFGDISYRRLDPDK